MTNVSVSRAARRQVLAAGVAVLALGVPLAGFAGPALAAGEVNIYSYRQEVLIRPLLDEFTKTTGTKVNIVYVKDAGIERLKAEGKASPADAVLTVDVANLVQLEDAGLLQPVKSATIEKNIPAQYRDPDGKWFGLSLRARTIVYSTERVKPGELSTYEALADENWEGRLCLRTSKKVYNQSLTATLLETLDLGKPMTPFLSFGDRVRIEMLDGAGRSIFGAIDQRVVKAA